MTELFEAVDAADRDLALRAGGLLGQFNSAGVLTAADVHVARAVGLVAGEHDETVLLAAALACRAVRGGAVCLDLQTLDRDVAPDLPWPEAESWRAAIAASRRVEQGVLRHEQGAGHDLVYLDRYHEQETQILHDLTARAGSTPPHDAALMAATLDRVFAKPGYAEQRAACLSAAGQWTTVITGGPGTGKTTAVAGLLVALHEQYAAQGQPVRIALTAPTGRAAARLQESLRQARLDPDDHDRLSGVEAMTIHRLLRLDPGNSTRFRHHRANRLPHDVVVVDETSMVSLTLMARLLEAVRPDARLVLVGDPDQLASVEAGAVLNDIVTGYHSRPDTPVAQLVTAHRFGDEIGALARAIRDGDADAALEELARGGERVRWVQGGDDPAVREAALGAAQALCSAATGYAHGADVLKALEQHRLLCAHREGPYGVRHWNRRVEHWLADTTATPVHEWAYVGRPVLITANDYVLGVYNGDSGVVVDTPEGRRVVVAGPDGPRLFAPARLGDVETMHAMTIHKAQGSQARHVTVVLPDEESRLLTRQLFYTAVTRAQEQVTVVGPEEWVRAAIGRVAQRASGLAVRLAGAGSGHGHETPSS
ncbi:MAG: exodeoxyribonuclease V subunit alpha [Nocardioides sp.]|nr:exodeoxyribonuclease V subunit alpha [Nocardioides sp.]